MTIIPYDPQYKNDFIRLNTDWILRYFGELEPPDIATFEHIEEALADGAMIYFALDAGGVLATCMARPMAAPGDWEICKMGANGHRPHAGAGSAVFEAARDWALDHGAARLVIIGNTGLAAARHIYEKYGFRGTPAEDCGYRRGDIAYIYDTAAPMREADKLDAGLPYCYDDPEVDGRKQRAIAACRDYNAIDPADFAGQTAQLARMLGHAGEKVWIGKAFNCDNGRNIHIGRNFTGNYNLTILDIREVRIGDNVMIGPNTLITTVNHPMTPMGRRVHIGIAKPVFIGDDVWIGGNVTILPGVHIGSNVVVAAGAVVTRDVPDNTLVGGVPAKKIRTLVSDVPPAEACRPAEGTVADDD